MTDQLPIDTMSIADHEAGSVHFVRECAEHTPTLDALLEAIRRQIQADEDQRRNRPSPLRRLLWLAQAYMLRHHKEPT